MYRSLLVPLDGSAFAEHALPPALGVARRAGASLRLVRVADPLAAASVAGSAYDGVLEERLRQEEQAYLDGLVRRLQALAPVPVSAALLDGDVAGTLCAHAADTGADLVVMATHGRGPLSRFWLGSVADELARRLPMPLLLLRPGDGPPDLAREPSFPRVLVPLDGSPRSEGILGPATDLGRLCGAHYTLVRVVPPAPAGAAGPAARRYEGEAEAYLGGVAERLCRKGLHARPAVVVHEHPAGGILGAVGPEAAGVVALATRGHGGLKRLLLGSVADKVLRAAPTPVLLYRPLEK